MNETDMLHKDIRFLILYTEYFRSGYVLDSRKLYQRINKFAKFSELLDYVRKQLPKIINQHIKESYAKRHFYTQAGYYLSSLEYQSSRFLYNLSHKIIKGEI